MRYDWRENGLKFMKKRSAVQPDLLMIGPGGDPDVKRLENYLERMNLDYQELDTREDPLPEGFNWADQPILVVNGEVWTKVKPQEVAQIIGLALRHYGFDEEEASA